MYNWIETTFNVSGGVTQAIAVILALAVVLLLFGLFIFILKRLMGGQAPQSRNRQPRIAVMDSASIDTRRRLVLIRRDNIEHLLLIGGPSDVVVEPNIVRHMPLPQQRPGSSHGLAGQAPVRGPMAPGPDIPPTPEDLVAQNETPPPPTRQARPPATEPAASHPTTPAPATPAPATAPAASAAPSSKQQPLRARSEPPTHEPAPAPVKAPAPKPETASGLNRAADLLRAATQNGFNRAGAKTSSAAQTSDTPPLKQTATTENAPEVRPVAKPADTPPSQTDSQSGSTLNSLARPFTPRDRPSYGNHSISPPASGPAARAKTALLKPLEAARGHTKVEPVLTATTQANASSPAGESLQTSTSLATQPDVSPMADKTPSVPPGTLEAVLEPDPSDRTSNVDETSGTDVSIEDAATAKEAPASKASESRDVGDLEKPAAAETSAETGSEPPETAQKAAATGPDISLDMNDLLEAVPADAPVLQGEHTKAEQTETDDTQKANAQAKDSGQEPTGSNDGDISAPDTDQKKSAAGKASAPVKPAPRPTGGLGDKNPIEEEMAKILDELGGQQN